MAKPSVIAARQARAMEDQATLLAEVIERLERIEKILEPTTLVLEPFAFSGFEVLAAERLETVEPEAEAVQEPATPAAEAEPKVEVGAKAEPKANKSHKEAVK